MKIVSILLSVSFLMLTGMANAQSIRDRKDSANVKSFLNVSIRYKSDHFFMGRSDSAKVPYVVPSIAYYHKSGFFLSSGLSYLTTGDRRVDLYTIGAGYDYFGKKLATGISVSQYYYDKASYSVQSEMTTFVNAYLAYDFKLFTIAADASMGATKDLDMFAGAEISRPFYLLRDRLRITPSAYVNFGTQYYYNQYYKERSIHTGSGEEQGNGSGGSGGGGSGGGGSGGGGDGDGSGNGGSGGDGSGNGGMGSGRDASTTLREERVIKTASTSGDIIVITEAELQEYNKFQILDYELSLNVSYRIGAFRLLANSTVLFPVNPSKVVTDKSTYEEELSTGFLWSAGIRYIIR